MLVRTKMTAAFCIRFLRAHDAPCTNVKKFVGNGASWKSCAWISALFWQHNKIILLFYFSNIIFKDFFINAVLQKGRKEIPRYWGLLSADFFFKRAAKGRGGPGLVQAEVRSQELDPGLPHGDSCPCTRWCSAAFASPWAGSWATAACWVSLWCRLVGWVLDLCEHILVWCHVPQMAGRELPSPLPGFSGTWKGEGLFETPPWPRWGEMHAGDGIIWLTGR